VYNNNKIRKIVSIQRKKEVVSNTLGKMREKLIRWRKFSKTTLVNPDTAVLSTVREDMQKMQEENKKELREWATKMLNKTEDEDKKEDSNAEHGDANEEKGKLVPVVGGGKRVGFEDE